MLPLDKQVTSLILSKKLKELGVPQESLFAWCEWQEVHNENTWSIEIDDVDGHGGAIARISAFTVAELGEMLPVAFWSSRHKIKWECGKSMLQYDNWRKHLIPNVDIENAEKEADARAKMFIYLIENNFINPKDL